MCDYICHYYYSYILGYLNNDQAHLFGYNALHFMFITGVLL
jgi:hypothetical protein